MLLLNTEENINEWMNAMDKKKLIIQSHRYIGESSVISLRLPKEMLRVIDEVVAHTGRTRNEILVLSLEYALENMEIDDK